MKELSDVTECAVEQGRSPLTVTVWLALLLLALPLGAEIVFQDAFNRTDSPALGPSWQVLTGTMLRVHDNRAEAADTHQVEDAVTVLNLDRAQQTIDVDWAPTLTTQCSGVDGRILARVRDVNNYYGARVAQGVSTDSIIIFNVVGGVLQSEIARVDTPRVTIYPFHLQFTATGSSLEFRVSRPGNADVVLTATNSDIPSGSAGLVAFSNGGDCAPEARSTYDNFVISSSDVPDFIHPIEPWVISGYTFGADWEEEGCFTSLSCDPQSPRRYKHTGLDVAGAVGDIVVASKAGKVVVAVSSIGADLGGAVVLEHDMDGNSGTTYDRVTTLYLHVTPTVKEGVFVGQREAVATIARISRPHLHFGYRRGAFCPSDINAYLRGALPPADTDGCRPCFGRVAALPPFPENWEDPESIF